MTEDIPLEITSSDMANLPIFIAVLIVAAVVVRVYFSIKRNEKPPIARVFWCATLLIPLGVVAAWITNQSLVNEGSSLWVLSYSALGAAAVMLLVEPLVSGLIDQTDLATGTVACICRDILVIAAVSALSFVNRNCLQRNVLSHSRQLIRVFRRVARDGSALPLFAGTASWRRHGPRARRLLHPWHCRALRHNV